MRNLRILDQPYAIDESERKYKIPIRFFCLTPDYKYFVDGDMILWVWKANLDLSVITNGYFESPCLKYCLTYVMMNDPKFKGVQPSDVLKAIGIYEPFKAKLYNEEFKTMLYNEGME